MKGNQHNQPPELDQLDIVEQVLADHGLIDTRANGTQIIAYEYGLCTHCLMPIFRLADGMWEHDRDDVDFDESVLDHDAVPLAEQEYPEPHPVRRYAWEREALRSPHPGVRAPSRSSYETVALRPGYLTEGGNDAG